MHMWWPFRENIYSRARGERRLARSLRIKTCTSVTGMRMAVATLDSLGTRRDAENRTGFSRVSLSFRAPFSFLPSQ